MALVFGGGDLPDLVVAGTLFLLGASVFLARTRAVENVCFAAFTTLLAAGMLTGVLSTAAGRGYGAAVEAGTATPEMYRELVFWNALYWIPFVLDPIVLLYFASVYPRRNALNRTPMLFPFAAAAVVLLGVAVFAPSNPTIGGPSANTIPLWEPPWRSVRLAYMMAAYLVAFSVLAWAAVRAEGEITRQRARYLAAGLGFAVFARLGLLLEELASFPAWTLRSLETLIALGAAGLFYAGLYVVSRERESVLWLARWTFALVIAFAAIVWLAPLARDSIAGVPSGLRAVGDVIERARYGGRWLVFASFAAYSILRFQLFDLPLRTKRAALRIATLAVSVGGFALLAFALVRGFPDLFAGDPFLAVLFAGAGAFVLVKSYDAARAQLEVALPPQDEASARRRKLEVYRAAAENATPDVLGPLRIELGLDEAEARAIERVARAPREPTALAPGAVLASRYEIERLLARGGGGRVFLAHDPLLGRHVVVKEVVATGAVGSALVEARAASALSHPHVVTVYDVLTRGEDHVIVMEHMDGGSLGDRLRAEGALDPARAVAIACDVLEGLRAVHARRIVHGDVKPANVLLDRAGRAKIGDFGIARALRSADGTMGLAATAQGATLRYAAPEVLEHGAVSPRSDIYSVGALLVDMLAGAASAPRISLERVGAVASAELRAAIERALLAPPSARFAGAAEFLQAIRATPEASTRALAA